MQLLPLTRIRTFYSSITSRAYRSRIGNIHQSSATSISAKRKSLSTIAEEKVPITIKEDGSMVSSVVKIITPPRAHAACKKWIIFSDLHVKSSSIETCELVLKLVHEESVKRNAGIIFLGDFWHVRGSLSVELLNRVLKCLKEWTQPVIMIPGNHDQVTLGGSVHALEPLVYAFSREQILLIAEPTVCLGALWVPYRRDSAVMKAALAAATHESTREMVSVVFCHADVRGAYMNDGMRCREGLEIAAFPADLPIYSGHFHKPHTMVFKHSTGAMYKAANRGPGEVDREDSSTRLRYVGSPYQTSLSEAGQEKYLYCMAIHTSQNQMTWKEEERWPIDIGRKYIKATSLSDPNIAVARSGDRVILPVAVGDKYPAERLMNELKSKGIEVELKHEAVSNTAFLARQSRRPIDPASVSSSSSSGGQPTPVGNSTIEAAMMGDENLFDSFNFDQASPNRIFDDYMNLVRQGEGFYANLTDSTSVSSANLTEEVDTLTLSANSLKQQLFEDVFREGLSIIDRLASTAAATTAKNSRFGETKDLQMHQVRLSNFGPYGGPQEIIYPLSNRGLVLIRGESSDGTGADSNGSGKTTLAMSMLWALTGSLDTRLVTDGRAADVAFDNYIRKGQVDSSTDIEATTDSKGKVKKSRAKVRSTEADSAAVEIRTAEVTVNGTINGRPFFVTRRRSAKKSELLFSLDGKNLTTQAVKDTQAVMDEVLGIGGQLLQRCCFFGQHSHTLESLLGLTDVKLKNELSAMVDTAIWAAALQDVKAKDKVDKARLSEIGIEHRLRSEELAALSAIHTSTIEKQHCANTDLSLAKVRLASLCDTKQSELFGKFGNFSEESLTAKLESLQNEMERLKVEKIEPMRSVIMTWSRQLSGAVQVLPGQPGAEHLNRRIQLGKYIREKQDRKVQLQSQISSLNAMHNDSKRKEKEFLAKDAQLKSAHSALQTALKNISLPEQPNLDTTQTLTTRNYREEYENCLKLAAACDERLKALRSALTALQANALTSVEHDHGAEDNCPTCGQLFPEEGRPDRERELNAQIKNIEKEKSAVLVLSEKLKSASDISLRMRTLTEQIDMSSKSVKDVQKDLQKHESDKGVATAAMGEVDADLNRAAEENAAVALAMKELEEKNVLALKDFEKCLTDLQRQEKDTRAMADEYRVASSSHKKAETAASGEVLMLEERVRALNNTIGEQQASVTSIETKIRSLELEHKNIANISSIREMLLNIFGTRGIQNYVFLGLLKQIEFIANKYLEVLADGGIQLSMIQEVDNSGQTDEKDKKKKKGKEKSAVKEMSASVEDSVGERILKNVMIRGQDGIMRERGLSQLSGGQWRRVSMALDLAFAETVRRRGILKTNILVMDEVLTHLDASGREAVGSVLRALVHGSGDRSGSETGRRDTRRFLLADDAETVEVVDQEESSVDHDGDSSDRDGDSGHVWQENENEQGRRLKDEQLRVLGSAYQTVIVILQDLAAVELEESFDCMDVVLKNKEYATVIVDE